MPRLVGDEGIGRTVAGRDHLETGRKRRDLVAVAHPYLMLFACRPKPVEQCAGFLDLDKRPPEFAAIAAGDMPAKLHHHRLLAIANTKDRKARVKYALWRARGTRVCG